MQSSRFLGLSRSCTRQLSHSDLRLTLQHDLTRLGGLSSAFSSSAWCKNASWAGKSPTSALHQRINQPRGSLPFWFKAGGVAGVGLGLSVFTAPTVYCEPNPSAYPAPLSKPTQASPNFQLPEAPPPPQSSVSYYELTFGTVAGICTGVFVKKGAKAVAFMLGGVFVLLQYLGSLNLLRVDWSRMAFRFENMFFTTEATGRKKAPNVGSLFRWFTDFLTADFQQRASFIAGFMLGIRIG
ncbi:FUN14 family-domain-containing protein, partial [Fomitopsis betulina]